LSRSAVEASGGCTLLPEAEPGLFGGGSDIADVVMEELFECEGVGWVCAGERLSKDAMLGLVSGGLGAVARKSGAPRLGERRHADQVRIDEERLAGRDPFADRRQVEGIARATEEAVRDPEPLRARPEVLADEVPMVQLGGVDGVEDGRYVARNFGMQARPPQ
jgi:hypothetical protein